MRRYLWYEEDEHGGYFRVYYDEATELYWLDTHDESWSYTGKDFCTMLATILSRIGANVPPSMVELVQQLPAATWEHPFEN